MFRYLISLLPCLLLINGCVSTVTIDAEDNSARFSNLSASVPIAGNENSRLRFRATRVKGDFDQRLDAGERILLDGASIDGPELVDGEIDLTYVSVAIGKITKNRSDPEGFRTETYIGIARTGFDLEIESPNQRVQADDDTVEFYMQLVAIAPINENLDFGFSWAFSAGQEFSGISEIDLTLEYTITEHLSVAGGYRWFTYQSDWDEGDSDIDVDFRGPYLGLNFPF